jgi:hypothetical protein
LPILALERDLLLVLVHNYLLKVLSYTLVICQSVGSDGLFDLVGETLLHGSFFNKVCLLLAASLDIHLLG